MIDVAMQCGTQLFNAKAEHMQKASTPKFLHKIERDEDEMKKKK